MTQSARAVGTWSQENAAFLHWLRTGRWLPAKIETKFNPNHDPANGRFTSGPNLGLRVAARVSITEPHGRPRIVQLKQLSDDDIATVHAIAATKAVTEAMDAAWSDSQKTGRENGFFIYYDNEHYYAGKMVHGIIGDMTTDFYGSLVKANPLKGIFGHAVAAFHTHPGKYAAADNADDFDQNLDIKTGTISIIKTVNRFILGR